MTLTTNPMLGKYTHMTLRGIALSEAQAQEVIFRTDRFLASYDAYAGGNNHTWNARAREIMGVQQLINSPSPENDALLERLGARLGNLKLNCLHNDWASSNHLGGPYGWCKPSGELSYFDLIRTDYSFEELYEDFTKIAAAFPFLDMRAFFLDSESAPSFSIVVKDGSAEAVEPSQEDLLLGTKPSEAQLKHPSTWLGKEQGLPESWIQKLGERIQPVLQALETEAACPEARTPVPAGSRVKYLQMEGIVIEDKGGPTLLVVCEGALARWRWEFEGKTCEVVAAPVAVDEERPLPPGTRIAYADMEATVVEDEGCSSLVVLYEGQIVRWRWTFEDETCRILSTPSPQPA